MSIPLTVGDVAREAIRLAKEHPDATYSGPPVPGCFYTQGTAAGNRGCLFGQALANLGVPAETLAGLDRATGSSPISVVLFDLGVRSTDRADVALGDAQALQDNGRPWREAVEPLAEVAQ